MIREKTVFGPISSRRLGNSLGINLMPVNGKLCNFDCIYCECGWNRDGRGDTRLPSRDEVKEALENKLMELSSSSTAIDSITFSGDGEPTLNPDFPEIIDDTIELRDRYYASAKISVLSNSTRIHVPEVLEALKRIDNPILKLDAVSLADAEKINLPARGYDPSRTIKAMEAFNGDFILQTMFLKSRGFDSSDPRLVNSWMEVVRRIKPRQIMVYTVDRPTPQSDVEPFSEEYMKQLVKTLIDEGFDIIIKGKK